MAKLDFCSAYRRVPVHPETQPLLRMSWGDQFFCNRALPFVLCSAPKLFTAVVDALAWAMHCKGIPDLIHYLDNFLWSPGSSSECCHALEVAVPLCEKLGLPVAPHKVMGPATSLIFLGIEINLVCQVIRLPVDKLARLKQALRKWGNKRAATKRQLQSLIGHLNHAAKVVKPGRPFLRGLINTIPQRQHRKVRLCRLPGEILCCGNVYSRPRTGCLSFCLGPSKALPFSNASGRWSCSAFIASLDERFQLWWPRSWSEVSITPKELVLIVASLAV
uniref:Reverse transcriptase domain-containing protein n=1 Tax=Amphimedon queenslandica TaxID=400682 RepID=A0A1X7T5D0_AMPQE